MACASRRNYDSAFVWLEKAVDEYSARPYLMGPLFADLQMPLHRGLFPPALVCCEAGASTPNGARRPQLTAMSKRISMSTVNLRRRRSDPGLGIAALVSVCLIAACGDGRGT